MPQDTIETSPLSPKTKNNLQLLSSRHDLDHILLQRLSPETTANTSQDVNVDLILNKWDSNRGRERYSMFVCMYTFLQNTTCMYLLDGGASRCVPGWYGTWWWDRGTVLKVYCGTLYYIIINFITMLPSCVTQRRCHLHPRAPHQWNTNI